VLHPLPQSGSPAHLEPSGVKEPHEDAALLTLPGIDVFELNEAFAAQALHCIRELGIPLDKVNPNGGAMGAAAVRPVSPRSPRPMGRRYPLEARASSRRSSSEEGSGRRRPPRA
jgi:hypothetical protein